MKKTIGVFAIFATLGLAAAPFANVNNVQAQTPTPATTPAPAAAAQGPCTDEAKAAWYADFTRFRIPDAAKAYEAAKKYLTACPADVAQVKAARERVAKTDSTPQAKAEAEAELKRLAIPNYLDKWAAQYDKDARKIKVTNLFVDQRKYADAIVAAKQVLGDEPDNLTAHIALGYGGYVLAVTTKNESGNAEAITYAKKAIQLIESGKTQENWAPFKSKDDALGYLYYSVGYLERSSNPTEALTYFIKSAQFESDIKKNPQTYAFIAASYENEYAKQSMEYQRLYSGKDETPESKLAVENINLIVDRIIDALARAVSVAGTDANSQASKTQWLARLTELYKFRNKSEAGLTEMIASVMSKPLPPVPTRITVLPAAPTISTTPASGSPTGAGAGSSAGASPVSKPATAPPTTAATAAPKTTNAAATTPTTATKPKPKNNHVKPQRRG